MQGGIGFGVGSRISYDAAPNYQLLVVSMEDKVCFKAEFCQVKIFLSYIKIVVLQLRIFYFLPVCRWRLPEQLLRHR